MKKSIANKQASVIPELLVCIVLAVVGLIYYSGNFKVLTVLAGVAVILLLIKGDGTALRHPAALLLLAYVLIAGLSAIWALAGKFFLREYSKVFVAACCFVAVVLVKNFGKGTVRTLLSGMSVVAAVYSFLSVEYVTTGLSKMVLQLMIPNMAGINVTVEAGNRLTGILASPNPTATILSFSIFFTIFLMCTEENKKKRLYYAGVLALNAYTFLMLFSMAGTGLFALSLLVYLAVAGEKRSAAFVRMIIGAVPTLVWVFVGFPFLTAEGAMKVLPLVAMIANVVTVIMLEQVVSDKLIPVLEKRAKLAIVAILALIVVAIAYVVIAMNVGSAYTFGEGFRRSIYPEPGTHTISVQASGNVSYNVVSQNKAETIMHTYTYLGGGSEKELTFDVPEGSTVCYIDFAGDPGVTLEQVLLDGETEVNLKYPLLPAFIANRMQGLWANQNVIQRTAFFEDGMKLFFLRPLQGNGVGSFETALTSVQDFHYETKYVHNHYIQVLTENGVLGFVPFVAAMLALVLLLWKKRKDAEWIYREEYAPLCAALFMTLTHISFEVSMSNAIFLFYAYVTFGIIVKCCMEQPEEVAPSGKKGACPSRKKLSPLPLGVAVCSGAFLITVCANMFGQYLLYAPVSSEHQFMENMALAAQVDPYEKNDAKLSYVMASLSSETGDMYRAQADEFAAQLEKVHSNTIPKMMTQYYLSTGRYRKAVENAMASAAYSASDPTTWNDNISYFRQVFLDPSAFYVYLQDPELTPSLMAYYDTLCKRNAESMESINLNLASKDFFGKQRAIAEAGTDVEAMIDVLDSHIFHSATACDADMNNIPDQVTAHAGVTFLGEGTMEVGQGGWMDLSLYCERVLETVQVKISCTNPSAWSLSCGSTQQAIPVVVEEDCAVFTFSSDYQRENVLDIKVISSEPQQINSLEVMYQN